eukprot:8821020-Ditylum_brightwellii.AAC.1
MRQKTPSRESKSCNGENQGWSSQTAHSSLRLTQGKGDDSYNDGSQSQLSQTTSPALHLSCGKCNANCNDRIW